jgi:hypothetical protein
VPRPCRLRVRRWNRRTGAAVRAQRLHLAVCGPYDRRSPVPSGIADTSRWQRERGPHAHHAASACRGARSRDRSTRAIDAMQTNCGRFTAPTHGALPPESMATFEATSTTCYSWRWARRRRSSSSLMPKACDYAAGCRVRCCAPGRWPRAFPMEQFATRPRTRTRAVHREGSRCACPRRSRRPRSSGR